MLALVFGSTNAAIALVVAIFMAGLGLGGLFFGKKIDRTNARMRLFGLSVAQVLSIVLFGVGVGLLLAVLRRQRGTESQGG